jgi:phosphatidylglycerol:prolipoprotein diacylglycerol transferase
LCKIIAIAIKNRSAVLIYPNINPIVLQLGPLAIHWYGVMYLIGFGGAWALASYRAYKPASDWTSAQVSDLIFYCALGVLVGGRVGYMLFYGLSDLWTDPLALFKLWQGGMSFHGGLLGVAVSVWLFARKTQKSFFAVGDFIAPLVPIGLGAGRLGNFINGELWGRVSELPWAMVFPHVDSLPRHPSMLYEFLLEGVVLFIILWTYSAKPRPKMAISGLFLLMYGLFRILVECFRQPDIQKGFIAFDWLTMGQLLSVPMVILGGLFIYLAYRHNRGHSSKTKLS